MMSRDYTHNDEEGDDEPLCLFEPTSKETVLLGILKSMRNSISNPADFFRIEGSLEHLDGSKRMSLRLLHLLYNMCPYGSAVGKLSDPPKVEQLDALIYRMDVVNDLVHLFPCAESAVDKRPASVYMYETGHEQHLYVVSLFVNALEEMRKLILQRGLAKSNEIK